MKYTHQLKKLPKNEIELTITIPEEELKPFLEKAAANLSEQTKIEGFRPGKAPLDVVKQRVGEMKLLEEAAALAVDQSYKEVAIENKIEPLTSPKIDFEKLAPGNDFTYKATVAVIPEVKIGDWKSIKIKEQPIEIKDEEVDKVIESLREQRATEVLEDKVIEKGDKVELDFNVFRDNVPIENGSTKKYPLVIGSNMFIPGFEEQLIGLKKESSKEFELKFPEKYHNASLAGKPAKFKVKILNVYKRTLPELNQEFAQSLGMDSVEKLKQQIKENLKQEQQQKEQERIEVELLEKIIKQSEFEELPDMLVDAESNKMLQELESNVASQGLSFDDYLKHLNKTKDQLKIELAPQAVKRVKGALITRKIYFNEKFEIKNSEIDREIEKMKMMYAQNPEIIKNLETPQYREHLRTMLGHRKVIDLLKKTCVESQPKDQSQDKADSGHEGHVHGPGCNH